MPNAFEPKRSFDSWISRRTFVKDGHLLRLHCMVRISEALSPPKNLNWCCCIRIWVIRIRRYLPLTFNTKGLLNISSKGLKILCAMRVWRPANQPINVLRSYSIRLSSMIELALMPFTGLGRVSFSVTFFTFMMKHPAFTWQNVLMDRIWIM